MNISISFTDRSAAAVGAEAIGISEPKNHFAEDHEQQEANFKKEQRSHNRALITNIVVFGVYLFALLMISFAFGSIRAPVTNGEIIFIMVILSLVRTLFSVLVPIYNFEPVYNVTKEHLNQLKFFIHDTYEGIALYFA